MGLPEVSPASFVQRAVVAPRRRVSALVAPPDAIEETKAEACRTLRAQAIPFAEAELDGRPSSREKTNPADNKAEAVLIATTSEDKRLWRAVDINRWRFEHGEPTLFFLSEGAAKTMQRTAPHLMSLIGTMYEAEPRVDPRLGKAIEAARAGRYPELYEAKDAREAKDLDEATRDVIAALGDPRTDDRAWRRLGFMGRAVLVEVMPTIAAHWPPGLAAASAVSAALDTWLASEAAPIFVQRLPAAPLAPQALGEAMGVIKDAVHLMDRAEAQSAASELLDSIFQGYAVFPGSEGRRALFDWWLNDVVPAAAALRAPSRFERGAASVSPRR